jgi:methylmalonyl-CoA mutase
MSPSDSLPPLFDEFSVTSDAEWTAKIEADLGTSNTDDALRWDSIDGISLPAYRRRDDRDVLPHVPTGGTTPPLADTEETPANGWRIRHDLWHSDLNEARGLAQNALQAGVTDLGIVLDSRSGAPRGLPLETPDDLATLLRTLPLDGKGLHLDRGPGALVLSSALRSLHDTNGFNLELRGTVGYDPVGALASGTLGTVESAFDLAANLLHSPFSSSLRSLSLDLRPYHEAGASAVQELAYGLGALTETLAHVLERGASLDDILDHLHVQTAVSTSYFIEIAKLRALRLLVPQVIDAFSDETDAAVTFAPSDLYVQAETSRRTETLYDPHVNMLRGTTEAMAAVVGGCDVLNVRPYDAAFRSPSSFSTRIARNVQLILEHEAHFDVVSDPAAGAYYVEAATDRLAEHAWSQFQTLEADGGLLDGLRRGTLQSEIARVREQRRSEVNSRDRVLVGTNHYPDLQEERLQDARSPVFSADNRTVETQEQPEPSLERLQEDLEEGRPMHDLVAGLAVGPTSIEPLPSVRIAQDIETLRLRTERYAEREGAPPKVLLIPIGPTGPRSARATFARNVFGVAGFDVVEPLMFESPEDAAQEADEMDADIVVLCSANHAYSTLTPRLRTALTERDRSPLLVIAGNPNDLDEDLSADDFIHLGISLHEKLDSLQTRLDIPE